MPAIGRTIVGFLLLLLGQHGVEGIEAALICLVSSSRPLRSCS
jgi:hypothetical protein